MIETNTINVIEQLPGWCSVDKRQHLIATIESLKPSKIVEIGVFGGRSLIPMALAAPNAQVVGIDPWTVIACIEGMSTQANIDYWSSVSMLEQVYQAVANAIKTLRISNITLLRDSSENVAGTFEDGSIDILHIDGNHGFLPCQRDCQLYLPKVREGGIIYMDDEGWTEGGLLTVQPNIDWMMSQGCEDCGSVDGCKVLRKENI